MSSSTSPTALPPCIGGNLDFDVDDVDSVLESLSLASFIRNDYLIVTRLDFDVTVFDEPHIALMFYYNMKSGRFLARLWNKTVASGKALTLEKFVDVCKGHFSQGQLCLGFPESEEFCQFCLTDPLYLVSQSPFPRRISRACNGFITDGPGSNSTACNECANIKEPKFVDSVALNIEDEDALEDLRGSEGKEAMLPSRRPWSESAEQLDPLLSEEYEEYGEEVADESLNETVFGGKNTMKQRHKVRRCGECEGCMREECGMCKECLDKPKNGGLGKVNKACIERICSMLHPSLECHECGKVFRSPRSHYAHVKEMHGLRRNNTGQWVKDNEEAHACPKCGQSFRRKSNMVAHLRKTCKEGQQKEQKHYVCDTTHCGYTTTRKWNLQDHCQRKSHHSSSLPQQTDRPKSWTGTISQLIVEALMEADDSMLTGAEICSYVSKKYPSYIMDDHTWQQTLRRTLYRNEAFEKLPDMKNDRAAPLWKLQDGFDTSILDRPDKTGKAGRGPRKRKVEEDEESDVEGLEDVFKREKTEEIEPEFILKEEGLS